ncbi:MAG: extracellular solute-binding protein [Candidatus Eremiobacteraeota bacterium]|nr:extracellular solute-binding protein [Candidatus Eremiobacteraeota bacterium]
MKRTQFVGSSLAAGFAAAASPLGAAPRENPEVQRLYAEAKREGSVTWWTAHYTEDAAEKVRAAFKLKYPGIEVQFIRQTAQVIYQRLSQNLKSGVRELDVFASTDEAHYATLTKAGALASFIPPDIGLLPPSLRSLSDEATYHTAALRFVTLIFDPKKASRPRRWSDLLDPRYKNQLTTGHPGFSGVVGAWVVAMNDRFGWSYFEKFAKNQPKIGRSVNDTVSDIVSGERAIGSGPDAYAYERKAAGSSIDVAFPDDDAILVVNPIGVLKDAPHPNAARLFLNFFYSREYSQVLVDSFNFPLRGDVRAANGMRFDRIKFYRNKIDRLANGIPEVVAKWRETFGV